MLSDDNFAKAAAIQPSAGDNLEWENLAYMPFRAMRYNPYTFGTPLTIAVGDESAVSSYVVLSPKEIDAFYELNGQIFAVVITDSARAKTVIYFEDNAIVVRALPFELRQLLLLKAYSVDSFST